MSHEYQPFCFYKFLNTLDKHEHLSSNASYRARQSNNGDDKELDDEVIVDISLGKLVLSSDLLDYQMRPVKEPFNQFLLWEFIEHTQKVSICIA